VPTINSQFSAFHRVILPALRSLNQLLFVGMTLAGTGALALSTRKSWFVVPVAPARGANSIADIVTIQPGCTLVFKGLMAIGLVAMLASWLWKRQWSMVSTLIASILCAATLAFPYFVMLRSPVVSAEASWLQSQHDNLLWLGGDIHNNAEFAHRGWKSKVYLIDLPQQLAVVSLPSWSPWEMGLDRCEDLLQWLGYSNAFCNFVGMGWVLAAVGSSFLLLSSLQRNGVFEFGRAGMAIGLFTTCLVMAAVVGWSLPFRASQHINRSSELSSHRQFAESLSELQKAVSLLPVLAQDTHYVAQRGMLEKALGQQTDYTRLRDGITLEREARYDQAFDAISSLVDSEVPAVRREALRGVMRFAIHDYNCARFELSNERFWIVLRHQPCNLKLLYLMQLQGIRESRPELVDLMRDWIYESTNRMAFGTKVILRAAANQHCAIAAGMDNNPEAISMAQSRAKRP
jgi:hypothetical protein